MAVQMIKKDGKMVPAEFKDGHWVPIEGAVLSFNGDSVSVKKNE